MGLTTMILTLSVITGFFYLTTKIIEKDNEKFTTVAKKLKKFF